ncbi:Fic family protein [Rothia sp. 88186D007BW]
MKKYKSLKAVFHQFDAATAQEENRRRRAMGFGSSFQVGDYSLFYMSTPQLLVLLEQVLLNERTIGQLAADIPLAAQRGYLYELIVREITATNELEGVRSTRQEIQEALEAEPSENKSFREIARLYVELSEGKIEAPRTLQEIRDIYDGLFGAEISSQDALDGELFRTGPVYIRDGAGKTIHSGVQGEQAIRRQLQAMLTHLEEETPFLLSRVVSHFMFEAVHPFYDGNGRFGRFMLSAQLYEVLSVYTVLTLSAVIYQKKAAYYKAFSEVEEPLNMGDATYFAQVMLGFIRDAQLELISDFYAKKQLMNSLSARLNTLPQEREELSHGALESLFVLGQVHLFGGGSGLDWDTLTKVTEKSRNTVRSYIEELEQEKLIERVSSRPLRVRLSAHGKSLLFSEQA